MSDDVNVNMIADALNNKADRDLNNIERKSKVVKLWGGGSTWQSADTFVLSESYQNYDIIQFLYSKQGENLHGNQTSSYVNSKHCTVASLNEIRNNLGRLALFGYASRYLTLIITNDTTFTASVQGTDGPIGIIAIYGISLGA